MKHEVYFTSPATGKPDSVSLNHQEYQELISDMDAAKYNETVMLPGFGNITKQAYKGDKETGGQGNKPPTDPNWKYHLVGTPISRREGDYVLELYRRTKEFPDGRSELFDEVETSRRSMGEIEEELKKRKSRFGNNPQTS